MLATVQTISKFEDIEGKDEIKRVSFDNTEWDVIMNVVKDGSKVGDKVVYFEVNSLLPQRKEFEFLRPRCYSPSWEGFVIRPMKMAGMVSMGMAMNLKDIDIPELKKLKSGTDVTETIGVIKYDPELKAEMCEADARKSKLNKFQLILVRNKIVGNFFKWLFIDRYKVKKVPYLQFVRKAGETNVQDFNDNTLREKLHNFYVTEKVEGKAAMYAVEKKYKKVFFFFKKAYYHFYVCSHNVVFSSPVNNDYYKFAITKRLDKKMIKWAEDHDFDSFAISGELCGPGIQKNIYEFKSFEFFLFDVFVNGNLEDERWHDMYAKEFDVNRVPILYRVYTSEDDMLSVKYWKDLATGKSIVGSCPNLREGIVIRTFDQQFGFKSKSPEYALEFAGKEKIE